MSLSKSKCWYSNNCLHVLKCADPLYGGEEITHIKVLKLFQEASLLNIFRSVCTKSVPQLITIIVYFVSPKAAA